MTSWNKLLRFGTSQSKIVRTKPSKLIDEWDHFYSTGKTFGIDDLEIIFLEKLDFTTEKFFSETEVPKKVNQRNKVEQSFF